MVSGFAMEKKADSTVKAQIGKFWFYTFTKLNLTYYYIFLAEQKQQWSFSGLGKIEWDGSMR